MPANTQHAGPRPRRIDRFRELVIGSVAGVTFTLGILAWVALAGGPS